mgnify:CR=1 FL=1
MNACMPDMGRGDASLESSEFRRRMPELQANEAEPLVETERVTNCTPFLFQL